MRGKAQTNAAVPMHCVGGLAVALRIALSGIIACRVESRTI
jgi:hypothetical protein